jgi:polyphosphate kinase 2
MAEVEKKPKGPRDSIGDVVKKAEPRVESTIAAKQDRSIQIQNILQNLRKKEKKKIIESALLKYYEADELKPYQAELIKLQRHIEKTDKKLIILFDGRDASGKGGTIRRVTRYMNEKRYRVIALGKPNEEQATELHMKRYIECFPHAGEIVLFDRSWYNRAMVEPVMGFCTRRQHKQFMDKVISYEENFITDGKTTLLKLYFSVSKEEQARRFERRKNDPLRQWKLSEVDLQAQELWDEFTKKKLKLLQKTHTKTLPWYIIRSDDKHLARLETFKIILNAVRYIGRRRKLNFNLDPEIVIPGDKEVKIMKKNWRKYGKYEY